MIPKFRVWDKDERAILDVHGINFDAHGIWTNELIDDESDGNFIFLDDVELMQSTGLKDDFGNELFEGDIFESRFSGIKYVVYWDDKLASFWIKGETKTHPLYTLTPFHPRILGNIYENPELLEDN